MTDSNQQATDSTAPAAVAPNLLRSAIAMLKRPAIERIAGKTRQEVAEEIEAAVNDAPMPAGAPVTKDNSK